MLIHSSMQGEIRYSDGWRPDRRASLAVAFGAALLVCGGFLELLYKPLSVDVDHRPFSLSVVTTPPIHRLPENRKVMQLAAPSIVVLPQLQPLPPVPEPAILQEQAITGVGSPLQEEGSNGVFLQPLEQKYDDLHRALQAPAKPWSLKRGESYRSIYGETVMKSAGGGCSAQHGVQTGTTPDVQTPVGFMVSCPGEYQPSMADQLAEWAKKIQKQNRPPPG